MVVFGLLAGNVSHSQTVDFIIKPSNTTGCVPLFANFIDISSGGVALTRQWSLGLPIPVGGDSIVGANYNNPGTYKITLTVTFTNGFIGSKTKELIVHPLPVADFTSTNPVGCAPLNVKFQDASTTATGTITEWFWDLDGSYGNGPNPEKTYDGTKKKYDISLFVKNSWGCRSKEAKTKLGYVQIIDKPDVSFTATPQSTCNDNLTVTFKNTGGNAPNPEWDFGDGTKSTEANPVHTYNVPGSYEVTLRSVASSGCEDTDRKTINIGSPKATILSTPATVCALADAQFTGSVSPSNAWGCWIFGDRNVEVCGSTVNYSFGKPGTYEVKFIGKNSWGCTDMVKTSIVVKDGPKPLFTVDTTKSCKYPFTVQATNQTQGSGLEYTWDFGDGTPPVNGFQPPPHTYNAFGEFTIRLTARDPSTGCTVTLPKYDIIKITEPWVYLSRSPSSACQPPKPFTFSADPHFIDPVKKYTWTFGDGSPDTTTTGATITHTYTTGGTFLVTVTAVSLNNCSASRQTSVYLADTCVIDPEPEPPDTVILYTQTCDPCNSVTLKDTVANNTVTSWDMGDGTILNTNPPNPVTHLFPVGNASYTVTVERRNNTTGAISSTKVQVSLICLTPSFVVSKPAGCINDSVYFTPTGIDSSLVRRFRWDFGDGNDRTIYNGDDPPFSNGSTLHRYKKLGTFEANLTIMDKKNCYRTAQPVSILVQGPKPDFTAQPRTSCDSSFVSFFKDSTTLNANIPIVKWQWDFGDGSPVYETTKDTAVPKRYYGDRVPATDYGVTLTVTDSVGCTNTIEKPDYIRLYRPRASFYSWDTLQCKIYTASVYNYSRAVNATYTWRLGDGTIKTGENITHTFPGDGAYDVTLYVKDENGCTDSTSKSKYIKFVRPIANMSIRDTGDCAPVQVSFSDSSQYAYSWFWQFSNGQDPSDEISTKKNYIKPGFYTVKLTVTGPDGCKDSTSQNIKIKGATGTMLQEPLSGCRPFPAAMKVTDRYNITSYAWDYGDGTPVTDSKADSIGKHTYKYAGKYLPNVIIYSSEGCPYSILREDTIYVDSAQALFNAVPASSCDSALITVTNLSTVPDFSEITKYTWDWDNGQTSNEAVPVPPVYKQPGIYDIKLIIESKYGCVDTFQMPAAVKIFSPPQLTLSVPDTACQNTTLSFKGNIVSLDSITAINWLVNGVPKGSGNPVSLLFDQPGTFPVSLDIATSSGCNISASKPVTIVSSPVPNATPDTAVCVNSSIRLSASGGSDYKWTPIETLTEPNTATPLARPLPGLTKYAVTVSNHTGCAGTDTVVVRVDDSIRVRSVSPAEICQGDSITLNGGSNTGNFRWSPETGLDNAAAIQPVASPADTTLYSLVGYGNNTCPNDTAFVWVYVKPKPQVKAKANPVIANPGMDVALVAESSADVTGYQWSPASKLLEPESNVATWKNADTTTTFTVTVSNAAACTATSEVTVKVVCSGSSFAIPNAFTPGGLNPYFRPRGLHKSDPLIKRFFVFNRWGEIVYRVENTRVSQIRGWDGKVNKNEQRTEVFVWILEVDCEEEGPVLRKGTVTLIVTK